MNRYIKNKSDVTLTLAHTRAFFFGVPNFKLFPGANVKLDENEYESLLPSLKAFASKIEITTGVKVPVNPNPETDSEEEKRLPITPNEFTTKKEIIAYAKENGVVLEGGNQLSMVKLCGAYNQAIATQNEAV